MVLRKLLSSAVSPTSSGLMNTLHWIALTKGLEKTGNHPFTSSVYAKTMANITGHAMYLTLLLGHKAVPCQPSVTTRHFQ